MTREEAARKIGLFYLRKNGGALGLATEELYRLHISGVTVDPDGAVRIVAGRVGPLIGRRGENIYQLGEFLGAAVRVEEDGRSLYDLIIPRPEVEWPDYYDVPEYETEWMKDLPPDADEDQP